MTRSTVANTRGVRTCTESPTYAVTKPKESRRARPVLAVITGRPSMLSRVHSSSSTEHSTKLSINCTTSWKTCFAMLPICFRLLLKSFTNVTHKSPNVATSPTVRMKLSRIVLVFPKFLSLTSPALLMVTRVKQRIPSA